MAERKTLEQLAEDYEAAAEILTLRIRAGRRSYREACRSGNHERIYCAKQALYILYDERREAVENACRLRSYYVKSGRKKYRSHAA